MSVEGSMYYPYIIEYTERDFGGELETTPDYKGYFISDLLLRLGLVGTVIGFILMLSPIAEMESFESNNIRNLLTAMSSGMAVALFTTLTGLITSTLLKVQYFLADSAVVQIIDTLTTCENRHDDDASPNA